jgi:chromate transporter
VTEPAPEAHGASERVALAVIARQWLRLGCIGFGGPPAHIALLRKLCVQDKRWLAEQEFEDGVATVNLLPGPASTQLTIYAAWRLRGTAGALIGGAGFILPSLAIILTLSAVFLVGHPPGLVEGAALGAGSAVPAVAVAAAIGLLPASWRRAGTLRAAASPEEAAASQEEAAARPEAGAAGQEERAAGQEAAASREAGAASREETPAGQEEPVGDPAPGSARLAHLRWAFYLVAGGVATALVGPFLVLVLAGCGLVEVAARPSPQGRPTARAGALLPAVTLRALAAAPAAAGLGAVAWVAFKVGALSYGGGFVIIPLMQHDAVHTYHWMTSSQFLTAVALGQVTPGPVVQTVAVVGYAAGGVGGGLLASAVAFTPSFCFVLAGGPYFGRLRRNQRVQTFLTGAGPAAIGAIAGAAIPLTLALAHLWQLGVLALAAGWLIGLRRGVVVGIVGSALLGMAAYLAGAPVT